MTDLSIDKLWKTLDDLKANSRVCQRCRTREYTVIQGSSFLELKQLCDKCKDKERG